MQIDQNALLIILAAVVAILLVLIIANARRGPSRPPAEPPAPDPRLTTGDVSIEIRLSRLADLRSKGLVSEEEYERQRSKIVGDL